VDDGGFIDAFDGCVAADGHQTVDKAAFGIDEIDELEGGRCHGDGSLRSDGTEIRIRSVRSV
jgi:hypothetical protein